MIGTHQYQSTQASTMQARLSLGEVETIHSQICDPLRWKNMLDMPVADRYFLAHELLSHKEYFDPINKKIDEIITFFLLSFPYEPMAHDEKNTALRMAKIALSYEEEGHVIANRMQIITLLAKDYFPAEHCPNMIQWKLSPNATAHDVKLYANALALHTTCDSLFTASDRFIIKGPYTGAKEIVGLKESFVTTYNFRKVVQAAFHEFRHVEQQQQKTKHDQIQRDSGLFRRVNNIAPETAYFALMGERQAFVFDGWIEDVMEGKNVMRTPDQIIIDEMERQRTFSPCFIEKIQKFTNFIALASQSHAMPSRAAGYLHDRMP